MCSGLGHLLWCPWLAEETGSGQWPRPERSSASDSWPGTSKEGPVPRAARQAHAHRHMPHANSAWVLQSRCLNACGQELPEVTPCPLALPGTDALDPASRWGGQGAQGMGSRDKRRAGGVSRRSLALGAQSGRSRWTPSLCLGSTQPSRARHARAPRHCSLPSSGRDGGCSFPICAVASGCLHFCSCSKEYFIMPSVPTYTSDHFVCVLVP